jgi:hypothetical protein
MNPQGVERLKAAGLATGIWLVYTAGFAAHIFTRGWADDLGPSARSLAGVESFFFRGDPSVWLQHWTPDDGFVWKLAAQVHATWFYLPLLLVLLVQFRGGTRVAAQLLGLQLALLFSTDIAFVLVPTRPPWMDFDLVRVVAVAYGGTASIDSNPVAAMPSLHVALPALYVLWFARSPDGLLRKLWPLLALWTVGVAWSVVYGGEHYVIDALAGVVWAAAVWYAYERARTWWRNRQVLVSSATNEGPLLDQPQAKAA